MSRRDIVVIGGSAGGIPALMGLARGLPENFPAALFVALHSSPDSPGFLPELIARAGPLPAAFAVDGQRIQHGRFYIAPPDRHLLVANGTVNVARGPRENGFRPAADPLFRTAAHTYGSRVVGIVLSGGLNDGTHGLEIIKRYGGLAIVQHLDDALVPHMPASALYNVKVDHVLRAHEMPAMITRLANHPPVKGTMAMARSTSKKARDPAERGAHGLHDKTRMGAPSPFTCPECGGALWESKPSKNNGIIRYKCHVGHSLTAESLMAGQDDGIEGALWGALRALEEKAALRRRMAHHARNGSFLPIAKRYDEHAAESERQANLVRAILTQEERRPESDEMPVTHERRRVARRAGGRPRRRKSRKR